jgi:hypothetical protein
MKFILIISDCGQTHYTKEIVVASTYCHQEKSMNKITCAERIPIYCAFQKTINAFTVNNN